MSARLIEESGFELGFMSGFAVSAARLGMPDTGLISYAEMVDQGANICRSASIPMIGDGDTGFGSAQNIKRTVQGYAQAGFAAIMLEDQVAPKRCGHFSGKEVISMEEAVNKIKAAVDARHDPDLLILARTDACATLGFEAAVERAHKFAEAGADILFVEAVTTEDEIRALPQRLSKPQLMNVVIGGRTPIFGAEELGSLGYGIVLYANAALQGAIAGMQKALTVLRDTRRIDEDPALVTPFAERQRLVGKPEWDALDKRYS
jgi:2-methylisocitrate lyase-like PEP mutase family enzyme